jgi:DNA-binding transcriptional ArsR family regulator
VTATDLATGFQVSRQAVAKHLGTLRDAGLVSAERHGREMRYQLTPAPLIDAVEWIADVGAAWDRRLDRLATRLAVGRSGRAT